MAEKSYQEAVQTLKQALTGRWEGAELDGRDEMARILRDQLGYDRDTAKEAIDAMIASGTLRYHRAAEVGGRDGAPAPAAGVSEGVVTGVPATGGMGGMPLAPAMLPAGGHWEIDGEQDEPAPGRGGQVKVDY
jgi:hypothetical protein